MAYSEYEEIDLRELIMDLWNSKWFICGITLLFILVAGIYSFFIVDPVYQANTSIQLSNVEGFYSNPLVVTRLLKSNGLVMPVMNTLGLDYTEAELQNFLKTNMNIESENNSGIIDVNLKSVDYSLANKILDNIIIDFKYNADIEYDTFTGNINNSLNIIETTIDEFKKQISLTKKDIENISNSNLESSEQSILIAGLTNKLSLYIEQENKLLEEKRLLESELASYRPLQILTAPYIQENPVSPRKMLNVAIAGVLGVFLSIFIVFFRKFLIAEISS